MFKTRFKIVEIRNGGVTVTHYLVGTKNEVNRDVKTLKQESKKYEMFGKEGMIVWT